MCVNKTIIDMERSGQKIQRYAKKYGYSVKDIQYYLGLSCPQPIYRWYKGIILPSVDNLLKLSELFHVHMEDLLARENEVVECPDYRIETYNRERLLRRARAYYVRLTV